MTARAVTLYISFHIEGKTEGLSAAGLRDAAPGKVVIATLKEIYKIKVVTITSVVYISLCPSSREKPWERC